MPPDNAAPTDDFSPECPHRLMTEGEGALAYEAFKAYFEQGNARSVPSVAEQLSKSRQLLNRWALKYRWNECIDALMSAGVAAYQRETEKQSVLYAARNARRRQKIADASFDLIKASHAKAKEVLRFVVVKEVQTSQDGKTIIIKSNPNVRLGDAVRLLVGGNVALAQADNVFNPKKPGKPGQKPDGSPLPINGGNDQPGVEIWLDAGDGTPLPLSQMPPVDVPDPNFHPDADTLEEPN